MVKYYRMVWPVSIASVFLAGRGTLVMSTLMTAALIHASMVENVK